MAKIRLKEGSDPQQVAEELRKMGITMKQRLPDGSYVVYIGGRQWWCMQFPALVPLYKEDRAFWKAVRKRTRNGEDVPKSELEAHTKHFNEQFDKIVNGK